MQYSVNVIGNVISFDKYPPAPMLPEEESNVPYCNVIQLLKPNTNNINTTRIPCIIPTVCYLYL